MVQRIPLTQGQFAIVDDVDAMRLLTEFPSWFYSSSTGYACCDVGGRKDKRRVYMHKVICDAERVDHRDGDKLNCRRRNLRPATVQQNAQNRAKNLAPALSAYKGVSIVRKTMKWRAYIVVDKKQQHLGCFEVAEDAARAYDAAAREHFGEFARLNFP